MSGTPALTQIPPPAPAACHTEPGTLEQDRCSTWLSSTPTPAPGGTPGPSPQHLPAATDPRPSAVLTAQPASSWQWAGSLQRDGGLHACPICSSSSSASPARLQWFTLCTLPMAQQDGTSRSVACPRLSLDSITSSPAPVLLAVPALPLPLPLPLGWLWQEVGAGLIMKGEGGGTERPRRREREGRETG